MGTLSGVLPILPTIFSPSGSIDEAGTRRVVEYIIASGAQGNTAATSFIGYQEFVNGLKYMNDPTSGENSKAWSRYLEVWTLDGDLDGNVTADGKNDIAPGTAEKANFSDLGAVVAT